MANTYFVYTEVSDSAGHITDTIKVLCTILSLRLLRVWHQDYINKVHDCCFLINAKREVCSDSFIIMVDTLYRLMVDLQNDVCACTSLADQPLPLL